MKKTFEHIMTARAEQMLLNLRVHAHACPACMIHASSSENAQALNIQGLTKHRPPFSPPPLFRGMIAARIWLLE